MKRCQKQNTQFQIKKYLIQIIVGLSKNIDDKIKAMKIYRSQLKEKPHPRSSYGIKTLSSYRGLLSYTEYSEAFIIIRNYES